MDLRRRYTLLRVQPDKRSLILCQKNIGLPLFWTSIILFLVKQNCDRVERTSTNIKVYKSMDIQIYLQILLFLNVFFCHLLNDKHVNLCLLFSFPLDAKNILHLHVHCLLNFQKLQLFLFLNDFLHARGFAVF